MNFSPQLKWIPLWCSLLGVGACTDSNPTTEMVSVEANAALGSGAFLIDRLENTVEEIGTGNTTEERATVVSGATPRGSISYDRAKTLCEAVSKRLCTYVEWRAACRGKDNLKYGVQEGFETPDPLFETCITGRGDELGGLLPGVETQFPRPTGEKTDCANRSNGVGDLVGNLSEWVLLDDAAGEITGSPFTGGVPAGGNHLVRDEQNHCDFILFRDSDGDGVWDSLFPEDTESPLIGFRCCRDAG